MTRVAFTADLHVDAYGQRVDPETGLNARLVDYLRTVEWTGAEAVRRGAAALVVAGDLTERRHPAPWLVARIREALEAGPEHQVYLRGNHDGAIADRSIVDVLGPLPEPGIPLEEIARVGVSRPMLVPLEHDVVLAAIPYLDRHWLRAQAGFETVPDAELYAVLGEQFLAIARALYAEARRDYPDAGAVLVCHQALAGAAMSDAQAAFLGDVSLVVDSRALAAIGFEAVVAGHLHRHQVVVGGDRPVLYAGSVERVDFGEERETKGFVVADVGPGRFEWEFVETPARRFVTLQSPRPDDAFNVHDAIVRAIDVDPDVDVAELRRVLEADRAFEVSEIRMRPQQAPEVEGGLSESLSAEQALDAYFAEDPDREALVARGREVLAEVVG